MNASEYVEQRTKVDLKKVEQDLAELERQVAEAEKNGERLGWTERESAWSPCSPALAEIWRLHRKAG